MRIQSRQSTPQTGEQSTPQTGELLYYIAKDHNGNVNRDSKNAGARVVALNMALANQDRKSFEKILATSDAEILGQIESSLDERLWNFYANRSQLDDSSLSPAQKSMVYRRLSATVELYFEKHYFVRSQSHMNQVMMTYLSLHQGGNQSIDALNQYVKNMPFAVQSRFYRHTKGVHGEVLFWLKYVATTVLFVVTMKSGFNYLFRPAFFSRILPTLMGMPVAMISQSVQMLSWVSPSALMHLLYFIGGIFGTVGMILNFVITPFLFLSAWFAVLKLTWLTLQSAFQNLFTDPPDFSPVKTIEVPPESILTPHNQQALSEILGSADSSDLSSLQVESPSL